MSALSGMRTRTGQSSVHANSHYTGINDGIELDAQQSIRAVVANNLRIPHATMIPPGKIRTLGHIARHYTKFGLDIDMN